MAVADPGGVGEHSGAARPADVLDRLRDDLMSGELLASQPLRLAALRDRYDVGLTPLREALFGLVAEGLVTFEARRGFRAAALSVDELYDVTEQRVLIESQALRRSLDRGNLAWESRVLAAHHRLAGTGMVVDGRLDPAWVTAHRDFHRVLVEACGSPWLLRFRDVLADQSERYRRWSVLKAPERDVAAEHRGLADSVLARDAETATSRLAEHYWRTAHLCELPAPATDPSPTHLT